MSLKIDRLTFENEDILRHLSVRCGLILQSADDGYGPTPALCLRADCGLALLFFVPDRDSTRFVSVAQKLNNTTVLEAWWLGLIPNSDVELAPEIWILRVRGAYSRCLLVELPTSQKPVKFLRFNREGAGDDDIGMASDEQSTSRTDEGSDGLFRINARRLGSLRPSRLFITLAKPHSTADPARISTSARANFTVSPHD